MRSKLTLLALAVTATAAAAPADAGTKITLYVGAHPLSDDVFCVIEAPHQHAVRPFKSVLFRVHDGHHHFVGDPVAHGWSGPKYAYVGHHPIDLSVRLGIWLRDPDHTEVYCYITGPHFHAFQPAPALRFELKGEAYWYVGELGPAYKRGKRRYVKPVTAVYAEIEYPRPVIEVRPPAGFVGVFVGPGEVEATGGITAGVELVVPRPVLEVDLGFGVDVGHHHRHRKHHKHRKHRKHRKFKKRRRKGWGYVRGRRRH